MTRPHRHQSGERPAGGGKGGRGQRPGRQTPSEEHAQARRRQPESGVEPRPSAAHSHGAHLGQRDLAIVLGVTTAFMVAEFVGGWLANSLALVADAAHMLADVGSLALSLFALWFARRPATAGKTYGYVRLEILAAVVNGTLLLVLSGFVIWEAVRRLGHPEPVRSTLMLAVATAGLAANVVSAFVLRRQAGESLNVRGAYLHVIGDLLGSVGAIAAAIVIMATGWYLADPIISFLVSGLIIFSSWHLLRESVDVLLEAVPPHIDLEQVRDALQEISGVDGVHDLHVWTLTSGYLAMSGHAVVPDPRSNQRVLDEAHRRMRERFGIQHSTIQIEWPAPVKLRGRRDRGR